MIMHSLLHLRPPLRWPLAMETGYFPTDSLRTMWRCRTRISNLTRSRIMKMHFISSSYEMTPKTLFQSEKMKGRCLNCKTSCKEVNQMKAMLASFDEQKREHESPYPRGFPVPCEFDSKNAIYEQRRNIFWQSMPESLQI